MSPTMSINNFQTKLILQGGKKQYGYQVTKSFIANVVQQYVVTFKTYLAFNKT